MKKKVKKIPKYNSGGSVYDTLVKNNPLPIQNNTFNTSNNTGISSATAGTIAAGKTWDTMNKTQRTGAIVDAAGTAINSAIGSIGKPVTAAGVISGGLAGAQAGAAIGGPIGAGIGFAGGALLSSIGNKASTDGIGNETYSSGITRWLGIGKSDHEIRQQANWEKNSVLSRTQTQNLQADYYNENPTGSINILAAEGGIMRQPVDALVSPGEIAIDPYTLEYRQFGSDNEEPNSKDNIRTVLKTGDNVKSHAEHMIMPNGKTPADNSKMVLDSNMPEEMKRKMIKKIDNWESAHRTKPQQYAKFAEGDPGFFNYLISNRTRPIDAVISEYMKQYGKTANEFKGFDGSDQSFLQGLQNIITANNKYVLPIRFKGGKSFDQVRSMPISSAVEFNPEYWDYYNQQSKPNNTSNSNVVKSTKPLWQSTENIGITTHPEIDNVWSRHKTSDFVATETPVTTVPTVSKKKQETTVSKKGEVSKPSSGKKTTTSQVTASTASSPEDTVLRRPERVYDYEEPVKAVTAPVDDKKVYGRDGSVRYDYTTPERKVTPEDLGRTTNNNNNSYTGSNWRDGLYRMAVLSQPLWDRAEAEPVNYESPVYKYMPTQIDVSSQLRDADQSYALARYNFANLYPNTGAGMAAGLQAATDRAKQYANIRQYQTNAQNELIGKNVGIYNNWANEHARILNDVYNKTAANRAAARNINRQNRAAALSNYGQMLRDDKQFAMDTMKLQMMEPMMQYGYENYNDYLNWKKANGYG